MVVKVIARIALVLLLAQFYCASAQEITARYYPEKQRYLVGEPVIVVFEIVNNGPKKGAAWMSGCRDLFPGEFEVDGASPRRTIELFGCRKLISIDCLMGSGSVPAHGKFRELRLLKGAFALDSPGSYRVRAKGRADVHTSPPGEVLASLDVESEFDLDLRTPLSGELEAAYQPLIKELKSGDFNVRDVAAAAITQNPPPFAEATILDLANDHSTLASGQYTQYVVDGLQRLATPAARAKLVELASPPSSESVRQPAIQALGIVGNSEDCKAMLAIAKASSNYTQALAYIMAGRICRESALPTFVGLLDAGEPQLLMGVAGGLVNTGSPSAVLPLIAMLQNKEIRTRQDAASDLAALTHRESKFGVEDEASAAQAHADWLRWWNMNGAKAELYSYDQCAAPQPLN